MKHQGQEAMPSVAFTKKQLIKSKRFTKIQQDVLSVLLREEEKYTLKQAEGLLRKNQQQEVR